MIRKLLVPLAILTVVVATQPSDASASVHLAGPSALSASSDDFPESSTSRGLASGVIDVTTTDRAARFLDTVLDGRWLSRRSFTGGSPRTTQVEVAPTAGRHRVTFLARDGSGALVGSEDYEFGVAAPDDSPGRLWTLAGRVSDLAGRPVAGIDVQVVSAQAAGENVNLPVIGASTTGVDGVWHLRVDSLSTSLTALAGSNDGVLNVMAVADGAYDHPTAPVAAVGGTMFLMGVAVDGKLTEAAARAERRAIPDMVMLPQPELATPSTTAGSAPSALPLSLVTATTTPAATDYTHTPVTADLSRLTPRLALLPMAAGDECYVELTITLKNTRNDYEMATVLEGHAYQDAKASVKYSATAGTEFSAGLSTDHGSSWSVSGSAYAGNSMSWSSGYSSKGPYYAKQWKVPGKFSYADAYKCTMVNGVKKLVYRNSMTQVVAMAPENGGATGAYGIDVSANDGYYGYKDAKYKYTVPRGSDFDTTAGDTKKFTGSAKVFNFSFSATTLKSSTRYQKITTGDEKISHYIFAGESIDNSMKVFFSY
jgi:hypothetical protein